MGFVTNLSLSILNWLVCNESRLTQRLRSSGMAVRESYAAITLDEMAAILVAIHFDLEVCDFKFRLQICRDNHLDL
jgi:hypothetical protein